MRQLRTSAATKHRQSADRQQTHCRRLGNNPDRPRRHTVHLRQELRRERVLVVAIGQPRDRIVRRRKGLNRDRVGVGVEDDSAQIARVRFARITPVVLEVRKNLQDRLSGRVVRQHVGRSRGAMFVGAEGHEDLRIVLHQAVPDVFAGAGSLRNIVRVVEVVMRRNNRRLAKIRSDHPLRPDKGGSIRVFLQVDVQELVAFG